MFGAFLIVVVLSTSLAVYTDKNPPKNYGWFQEDYWEQNDINSMDWDHPLREAPEGYLDDHPYGKTPEGFRQEENTKGRYFPKDKKKKDKKIIVPPIPIEDNNKDTTNTLV